MGIFTVGALLWVVLPLYDNSAVRARRARIATWFGVAALAGLIVLTLWGYLVV